MRLLDTNKPEKVDSGPWAEYRAKYIKARLELEKKHPPDGHMFYVRDRSLRIKHGIELAERREK